MTSSHSHLPLHTFEQISLSQRLLGCLVNCSCGHWGERIANLLSGSGLVELIIPWKRLKAGNLPICKCPSPLRVIVLLSTSRGYCFRLLIPIQCLAVLSRPPLQTSRHIVIWRVEGKVVDSVANRSEPGLAWAAESRAWEVVEIFTGSVYGPAISISSK